MIIPAILLAPKLAVTIARQPITMLAVLCKPPMIATVKRTVNAEPTVTRKAVRLRSTNPITGA